MKIKTISGSILLVALVGIVLYWLIYHNHRLFRSKEHQQNLSFVVPSNSAFQCFPIEIQDYFEKIEENGDILVFGRTVWHKDADSKVGGKSAQVPLVISKRDSLTQKLIPLKIMQTSGVDGNFILQIPADAGRMQIDIQLRLAKDCPEKYKKKGTKGQRHRGTKLKDKDRGTK